MKKAIISIILALLAIVSVSCSDGSSSSGKKNSGEDKQLSELYELGQEAVKIKVNEIYEYGSGKGYADVTITIPDYTELFMDCMGKGDPVSAVSKALRSSDYEKIKYETQVPVTFDERGEEIVHAENEINKRLEEELIKALNAVYEEREQ